MRENDRREEMYKRIEEMEIKRVDKDGKRTWR